MSSASWVEFRRGGRDLAGATIGLACGFACYGPITSFFFRALEHEFHWSKVAAAASLIGLSASALCLPFAGMLLDRFGVRRVAVGSALLLAACFLWLSRMDGSLGAFYAASTALAVVGAATGPVGYTRPISARFPISRGLALGIVLIGVSAGGVIMPLVIGPVIAEAGWRAAYGVLAAVAAVGGLLAFLLIRGPAADAEAQGAAAPMSVEASFTPRQALGSGAFWLLAGAIFAISAAGLGFVSQFQSLAIEHGVAIPAIPALLSVLSGSLCVSRLFVGAALDRSLPHRVAALAVGLSGVGLAALLIPGSPLWLTGVMLGFGLGAELDLLSFFCARRFGLTHFGAIYGLLGVFYFAGLAAGGLAFAEVHDRTGSYGFALALAAGLMGAAALMLLALGRYETKRA